MMTKLVKLMHMISKYGANSISQSHSICASRYNR